MKKAIVLLVVLLLFGVAAPLGAETTFRVVYNTKANPPRFMGDGTSIDWAKPGISLELFKMAEKEVGVPFTFQRMPWKRCLYMVEHGLADAAFHASYKAERAEYGVYPARDGELDPTRRVFANAYVFYVHKGSGVRWDGKALHNAPRPIGTQLSFAAAGDLRQLGYTVEEESSIASNLNKLMADRISAYAEIETVADNELRTHASQYGMIEKLQPAFRVKDYYLLISKKFASKHPELTERIWDAIRDMQKTEAYGTMLKKYED